MDFKLLYLNAAKKAITKIIKIVRLDFLLTILYNVRKEVSRMVYTLDELKQKIAPIARKYEIPAVWIFGSYARGDATEASDVDVLIDGRTPTLKSLFDLGSLYDDLHQSFKKNLDLLKLETISTDEAWEESPWLIRNIYDERVKVYEAS